MFINIKYSDCFSQPTINILNFDQNYDYRSNIFNIIIIIMTQIIINKIIDSKIYIITFIMYVLIVQHTYK